MTRNSFAAAMAAGLLFSAIGMMDRAAAGTTAARPGGPASSGFGPGGTLPIGRQAEIDGIIITLPNFGEERGLADALRLTSLQVPVLIQATPDHAGKMGIAFRRDSFCGKMSICNNLKQYGIPYSLTRLHTEAPDSAEFKADLEWFSGVCRVVRGLKNLRIGAIGAGHAVLDLNGLGELPLKGFDIGSADKSIVTDHGRDGVVDLALDALVLQLQIGKGNRHFNLATTAGAPDCLRRCRRR